MASTIRKTDKHMIIVCDYKFDDTSENYSKYIQHINTTMNVVFSPHYVIDTNGDVLELLDPDYIGDATGIRDIDENAISIVKIGTEPTAIQGHRLGDLLRDLHKRYPHIPHGKFWERYKEFAKGLECSGIFNKDIFKKLEV